MGNYRFPYAKPPTHSHLNEKNLKYIKNYVHFHSYFNNALDDFISLKENIRYDYIRDKVKNYVLLVNDEGGHLGYNDFLYSKLIISKCMMA